MEMSHGYEGMRWVKCDLHMHTPADKNHWRGVPADGDFERSAHDYIRRCYEVGLECIAITDHNFMSKDLLPLLKESAGKLAHEFGYEVVIFPGFEINADVGKGMHVLALFEPESDLNEVDHAMTNCGVPMPRQKADGSHQPSAKRLPDIISEIQKINESGFLKGIVICPHPCKTGIFDNDKISEWLQQQEWKNPDLFAVEVPKPIAEMSSGWRSLFGNGKDCDSDWKRPRPIAAVMSSDAKALSDDEDANNFIGKRYMWMKMSAPSIESLRQAFLDPESRICLAPDPPPVVHTHVRRIQIKGTKFLQNQEVVFSPHLNCLIGGRGSGKSMLFESLRVGMRGEISFKDVDEKMHVAARQVNRLKGTFQSETKIVLEVIHDGLEDRFIVENLGAQARIEGREVEDPPTVFRRLNTLIFSQEEITQLADRQKSLLEFVDSLGTDLLEPHRAKALGVIDRLRMARQSDEQLKRIDGELIVLKQELEELSRQLAAKSQVQEELKRHRAAQEANRYLDSLLNKAAETEERLHSLAEDLENEPLPLGSRVESFPEKEFFQQAEARIGELYRGVARELKTAADNLMKGMVAVINDHPDFPKVIDAINRAEKAFHEACDAKGLTPDEAEKLRETELQHRAKQAALQAKQGERDHIARQQPDMRKLLHELTTAWQNETETRQEILHEITNSETMPRTLDGRPIVRTSLTFVGDRDSFLRLWGELAPDRRTAAGRAWDGYARDGETGNIGDQLFEAFQTFVKSKPSDTAGNPVQWLESNWENACALPQLVKHHKPEIERIRKERSEKWFELMITRIPDLADLTLLRSDGTEAGSFQKRGLSTGQKNTAILSLLLARGQGPVLIDQPEDELDSEFLFRELVPMLRKAKMQRQLIIVTHNANIPVNADAELVYALKAEGGRGVCRTQGGLDKPGVTRAVLDIMEGSEEAFQRRKEKYHF
jgi:ABC-type dipeptide/oligopeptide/nickel transport system ATPase component